MYYIFVIAYFIYPEWNRLKYSNSQYLNKNGISITSSIFHKSMNFIPIKYFLNTATKLQFFEIAKIFQRS